MEARNTKAPGLSLISVGSLRLEKRRHVIRLQRKTPRIVSPLSTLSRNLLRRREFPSIPSKWLGPTPKTSLREAGGHFRSSLHVLLHLLVGEGGLDTSRSHLQHNGCWNCFTESGRLGVRRRGYRPDGERRRVCYPHLLFRG